MQGFWHKRHNRALLYARYVALQFVSSTSHCAHCLPHLITARLLPLPPQPPRTTSTYLHFHYSLSPLPFSAAFPLKPHVPACTSHCYLALHPFVSFSYSIFKQTLWTLIAVATCPLSHNVGHFCFSTWCDDAGGLQDFRAGQHSQNTI